MGANFETVCTVRRTRVPAGAWKDESLPLPSKPFCPSVPFKGTHRSWIGCPGNSGCQWPSLCERKHLGRKTSWVLAGERFRLVHQNLQPEPMLNMLELPTSLLTAGCPQVRRTTPELHRLTTGWVQFQTLNGSASILKPGYSMQSFFAFPFAGKHLRGSHTAGFFYPQRSLPQCEIELCKASKGPSHVPSGRWSLSDKASSWRGNSPLLLQTGSPTQSLWFVGIQWIASYIYDSGEATEDSSLGLKTDHGCLYLAISLGSRRSPAGGGGEVVREGEKGTFIF